VAGGAWGRRGANKYLLECEWARMAFTETRDKLKAQYDRLPKVGAVLIEDAANGPAIINSLRDEIPCIIPIQPKLYGGDKEARARATTLTLEAGNVFVPLHWAKRQKYIDEHGAFPNGTNDDAVDQQSQYLNWVRTRAAGDHLPKSGVEGLVKTFEHLKNQRL
jgi:predicted phage terminase large subunit-like protein